MLPKNAPALVLAPMDGITDAPMRAFQGSFGAFTYAVSEFIRVSNAPVPAKVFRREVPELLENGLTQTGLPVQVQLLGGDPEHMAFSAVNACKAGAKAIDINFGCPAPTVNRNDGGASLLKHPCRIREIVSSIRSAVPSEIPVSAKLRLGWDDIGSVHLNAEMAVEGGASWITLHARTRLQGYAPPVYWEPVKRVREAVGVPVIANGDLFSLDDFKRCQDSTGCRHFMIGRGALASPGLAGRVSRELGLEPSVQTEHVGWVSLLHGFLLHVDSCRGMSGAGSLKRLKQWLSLADKFGDFGHFDVVKRVESLDELFTLLEKLGHS